MKFIGWLSWYALGLAGIGLMLWAMYALQCGACPVSCACVNINAEYVKAAAGASIALSAVVRLSLEAFSSGE